jgi:hypothetical protein
MEPIKVLVQFDGAKINPLAFRRGNRLYKIKKLNMVYHLKEGSQTVFRFFVSDEANSYQLRFETETLTWFLEDDECV